MASGTNRGLFKVVDRQKRATIASIREIPHVYDLDVVRNKTAATGGTNPNAHRILITNNNNIVTLEFEK